MSFWKSSAFKKLNRAWRKKLAKSGFRDLENHTGNPTHLATIADDLMHKVNFRPEVFEEVQAYYRWAEDMANHARFKSTLDRKIWTLHAQGRTAREIRDQLPVKLDQTTISDRIRSVRNYLRLQIQKKKSA